MVGPAPEPGFRCTPFIALSVRLGPLTTGLNVGSEIGQVAVEFLPITLQVVVTWAKGFPDRDVRPFGDVVPDNVLAKPFDAPALAPRTLFGVECRVGIPPPFFAFRQNGIWIAHGGLRAARSTRDAR